MGGANLNVAESVPEEEGGVQNLEAADEIETKNASSYSVLKLFQTNAELEKKVLYKPLRREKVKQTHVPQFLKDKERLRCISCCKFCFTAGMLQKGPEVILRKEFHKNVKVTTGDESLFDAGRQGHMADTSCNLCKAIMLQETTISRANQDLLGDFSHTGGSMVW